MILQQLLDTTLNTGLDVWEEVRIKGVNGVSLWKKRAAGKGHLSNLDPRKVSKNEQNVGRNGFAT